MKKIRVIIADDHRLIREGIKELLEIQKDILVVGQAGDGERTIELAMELEADIILLDVQMPKLCGIETLRKFANLGIKTKTIMLTAHDELEYVFESLKLGANGYILKDSDSETLIRGIRHVAMGKDYIEPKIKELVTVSNKSGGEENRAIEKINSLTKREYEVLMLIAEGLSNKSIANRIYISEKTVKNHISNIFKKLSVKDRVQVVIFAYENNIKAI